MANAAARTAPSPSLESPDPQFRLAVGLYVALLAVPLVLYGAVTGGLSDATALYGVFLGAGLLVVALVTWALGRVDGGAVRAGNSRLRWLPPVPAVVLTVGSFALLPSVGAIAVAGCFSAHSLPLRAC